MPVVRLGSAICHSTETANRTAGNAVHLHVRDTSLLFGACRLLTAGHDRGSGGLHIRQRQSEYWGEPRSELTPVPPPRSTHTRSLWCLSLAATAASICFRPHRKLLLNRSSARTHQHSISMCRCLCRLQDRRNHISHRFCEYLKQCESPRTKIAGLARPQASALPAKSPRRHAG